MQRDLKKLIGGICLIIGGLFMIMLSLISVSNFSIKPEINWVDLILTINLWFIFFYILIFILPAIYLIYTSKNSSIIIFNASALAWFIVITILTLICIVIITLAGGIIARTSEGIDFASYLYKNFGYCLGLGFLFSFLVICLGFITAKLNH